jgi:hypothetical protein
MLSMSHSILVVKVQSLYIVLQRFWIESFKKRKIFAFVAMCSRRESSGRQHCSFITSTSFA